MAYSAGDLPQNGKDRAVVYIGLSLADQIDTVNTLTRYCIVVGIAVVLARRLPDPR